MWQLNDQRKKIPHVFQHSVSFVRTEGIFSTPKSDKFRNTLERDVKDEEALFDFSKRIRDL